MAEPAWFVAHVLVWGLLAVIAHELAHAITAVLVGRGVAGIDWRTLDVYWQLPETGPTARDYAIGATPLASGVVLALLAVLLAVPLSIPQWIALGFYAVHGGREDLQVTPVEAA